MKTLIVGGTSSIGKSLVPVFTPFGEVLTAGRKNCDIKLDLNNSVEEMVLPENLDVIIHTAAAFKGNTNEEILETESINVLGTLKLCQAAVKANVKFFIMISSIFSSLNENSPFYNIYSISKRQAEEVAKFYCSKHSLPLAILKPSQVYGNLASFEKNQPFFYLMIKKAEKGENITLHGSKNPYRNYIHINDLTTIILKVAQNRIEGTYSCAHRENISYVQIAGILYKVFGTEGKVEFMEDKPNISDNVFEFDNSLYEKINFYPIVSIEEGLKLIAKEGLK